MYLGKKPHNTTNLMASWVVLHKMEAHLSKKYVDQFKEKY